MMQRARFASVQARLQARHGARPDEADWRRLESAGELGAYLQLARQSPLRQWVLGLHASHGNDALEQALRQHFRDYCMQLASWMPDSGWAGSVRFCSSLIDLPALAYLLEGKAAPLWMSDDPLLREWALESPDARHEALQQSGYTWALAALHDTGSLPSLWYAHWQTLWPSPQAFHAGLRSLGAVLLQLRQPPAPAQAQWLALQRDLTVLFRRHAFEPAAAVAHLALVALQLERLRGALCQRALLADTDENTDSSAEVGIAA